MSSATLPALEGTSPTRSGERPRTGGDSDPILTSRLVLSDDLALESLDDAHAVVVHTVTGTRTRLSLAAYGFLKAFHDPRRVADVVPGAAALRLLPQVRMLLGKHMLRDADAHPGRAVGAARRRAAVAYRFCGAPTNDAATRSTAASRRR